MAFSEYRTHAIITRGLYTFYPIFEGQKRFLRSFFCKILTLCMVSIQERFQVKSGLYWRAYGNLYVQLQLFDRILSEKKVLLTLSSDHFS